jgi:zinc transport system substrate-binding protein
VIFLKKGGYTMKKAIILSILFLLFGSILAGCSEKRGTSHENDKITVYTTVYPLQYFTERIAGNLVSVESIYPPGADEHTFEPSQRDMMNIADAELFFYIGLGLEGFVEKSKSTLKNEGVDFISVGDKLNIEESGHESEEESDHSEEEHHDDHGDIDPHVWLDPIYAKELANTIKEELVTKLPAEEEIFEENLQLLVSELETLHKSFQSTIESADHKEVIVSHAAFGYWEKRYGLEQINISGFSSATEPSQKDLEKIVKIAKEKNLKYILFEQNVSSKLGEIIQDELGAKSLSLHNLATLTEENVKDKETYFSLMEENIDSLKTALND